MKYYKNTELAKLYHVSEKSVRNWIQSAQDGKLDLQLHEHNGRMHVANISKNTALIEELVEKGKKFKNTRGHKVVTPADEFYKLYNPRQILDIVSNLEIHREIPRQYNYFDGGAEHWDSFADQMWESESPTLIKGTASLLQSNADAIEQLLAGYSRINVVDLGVGNALPVKNFLDHLLKKDLLHRYIAIDISSEMLSIAEGNIKEWFKDRVNFEGHIRDITHERFDDLLVPDVLQNDSDRTINLVLLLGATLVNFRSPHDVLRVIHGSMGHNDLLVYTDKLDTEAERRYFDVNADVDKTTDLSPKYRFVADLLGMDPSLYEVEMGFSEQRMERYIKIRLKVAVTIKFAFQDGEYSVSLNKEDAILVWRAWHVSTLGLITQFSDAGFIPLQSSTTKDRQYVLTVSGVDTETL